MHIYVFYVVLDVLCRAAADDDLKRKYTQFEIDGLSPPMHNDPYITEVIWSSCGLYATLKLRTRVVWGGFFNVYHKNDNGEAWKAILPEDRYVIGSVLWGKYYEWEMNFSPYPKGKKLGNFVVCGVSDWNGKTKCSRQIKDVAFPVSYPCLFIMTIMAIILVPCAVCVTCACCIARNRKATYHQEGLRMQKITANHPRHTQNGETLRSDAI